MKKAFEDFDKEWKTGDRDKARATAVSYVGSHESEFHSYRGMLIPELVSMVSAYRSLGDEESRIKVDMFLQAAHKPQLITGVLKLGGK